ncbi:MAG: hypothetical protein ACU836_10080 [Gammaproteobacteria bacterium]
MRLENILKEELAKAGDRTTLTLGAEPVELTFTSQDKLALITRLEVVQRNSTHFAVVAIFTHFLVFLSAVGFTWYYRSQPEIAQTMIGGSALALLVIATKLRNLWHDKVRSDMLIAMLPNLTPAEAIKVIQSIADSSPR